jgi:hypothetical protein
VGAVLVVAGLRSRFILRANDSHLFLKRAREERNETHMVWPFGFSLGNGRKRCAD